MALVTVNLLDTFDQWRLKTNDLGVNQGDLTTLTTTNKSTIVAAINEVVSGDSDDMENLIDDTTPQLGGNLDIQAFNITGTGNISGTVTGVTQSPSNNSTKLATTAYVDAQVATENTIMEMDDTTIASLVDNDILQWNATSSVWENKTLAGSGLLTDVVGDTSPQLGANLDLNSKNVTGTGNISITGNVTATNLSGALTGTVASATTGVTQSAGDNSTKLATTAYANTAATAAAAGVGSGLVFAIALG